MALYLLSEILCPRKTCIRPWWDYGVSIAVTRTALARKYRHSFMIPAGAAMPSVAVQRAEVATLETLPRGPRVILIDDRERCLQDLVAALPAAGYAVYRVRNGEEALRRVPSIRPDLILLHLGLPDNGTKVIRHLRDRPIAPIIVISARNEESAKVSCLDTGAHDYLTTPFSVSELLARMRAALRSISATEDDVFELDNLRVDLVRRTVFIGETPVRLTATEYDLLKVLLHHAGKVRTYHQLIHEIWGGTQYQDAVHLLRVTLSHLRCKLRPDPLRPLYIETVPGVGYRLRTEIGAA